MNQGFGLDSNCCTAVWKVISIVLNKRTLEKVTITSGDAKKKITEVMGSAEVVEELFGTEFETP